MLSRLFSPLKSLATRIVTKLSGRLKRWTTPLTETLVGGAVNVPLKAGPL
jgi:hypothetical protein